VSGRRALALPVCLLSCLAGCALFSGRHWDDTRTSVIEPINSALHRHLPSDIKAKDVEAVRNVYATEVGTGITWNDPSEVGEDFVERRVHWGGTPGEEQIAERYRQLFDLFATIEKAEVRINRIYWDRKDAAGYPARVRLLVRGVGPQGDRRTLDQQSELRIDQRDGRWVITSEQILWREMVSSGTPQFEVATQEAGVNDVQETETSVSARAWRWRISIATGARTSPWRAAPASRSIVTRATARSATSPMPSACRQSSTSPPPAWCSSTPTTTAIPTSGSAASAATGSTATRAASDCRT
jgi:hypothetical protein